MTEIIKGECLCGDIKYQVKDDFKMFKLCHCSQCQKISGSAHVANAFTAPDNIEWLGGEEGLSRYNVPGRTISNVFCANCGTNMPYITTSGQSLIVPVGTLDKQPAMSPEHAIFWHERVSWYDVVGGLDMFDGMPK